MTSNIEQALLTCPCQAAAVQLEVAGQRYLADFTGHLTVGLDPNMLARYMQGAVNVVELLVQEHVSNGVGAVIGAISLIKDPLRDPGPSRLGAITPGIPFPAVQDMLLNINVENPRTAARNKATEQDPAEPWPADPAQPQRDQLPAAERHLPARRANRA